MEFKSVEKGSAGKFVKPYTLKYTNTHGNEKVYEMVSRKEIHSLKDLQNQTPDAVVLVVLSEDKQNVLIEKEFRLPIGDYLYNFPAGLIDDTDNTIVDTATRELKEETGLDLIDVLAILPPTYSAAGTSNELSQMVICTANGMIGGHPEEDEEIESKWYSKSEVLELIKTQKLASRTQMFCLMWAYN